MDLDFENALLSKCIPINLYLETFDLGRYYERTRPMEEVVF